LIFPRWPVEVSISKWSMPLRVNGLAGIDKIELTNTTLKMAAFIVQMHNGVLDGGFDLVQIDILNGLGYDVSIVDYTVVQGGTFRRQ